MFWKPCLLCLIFLCIFTGSLGALEIQGALQIGDDTFYPLEEVARALDLEYRWSFRRDSIRVRLGKEMFDLDPPTMIRGQVMLPLEILEELNLMEEELLVDFDKDRLTREQPLKIELATDSTRYERDGYMALSMIIHNPKPSPVTLSFSTGQVYDIHLKREGQVFWSWSQDKMFTQAFQDKTFEAGVVKQYSFLIPLSSLRRLQPGTYTLQGEITAQRSSILSQPLEVEIQ